MLPLCRHILPSGVICNQAAIKHTYFCRHHGQIKKVLARPPRNPNDFTFRLAFVYPEDHAAIQINLFLVLQALNDHKIDNPTANTMNRLLRSCELNLEKMPQTEAAAKNSVRRVILTPEGDEIAPPREQLEEGEAEPLHHKDCPCQRCAEEYRNAAPEQHHAQCQCGLCEEASAGESEKGQGESEKRQGESEKGKGESEKRQGESEKGKGESEKGQGESEKGQGESEKGKGESEKGQGESEKGKGESEKRQGESEKGKGESEKGQGESEKGKGESEKRQGESEKGKGESEKRQGESEKRQGESEKRQGEREKGKGESEKRQGEREKGKGESETTTTASANTEALSPLPFPLSPVSPPLSPVVRIANAHNLYAKELTIDPANKEVSLYDYLYGDKHKQYEAQYAARARAALEAGIEPPPYEPFDPKKIESEGMRRYKATMEEVEKNKQIAKEIWQRRFGDEDPELPKSNELNP